MQQYKWNKTKSYALSYAQWPFGCSENLILIPRCVVFCRFLDAREVSPLSLTIKDGNVIVWLVSLESMRRKRVLLLFLVIGFRTFSVGVIVSSIFIDNMVLKLTIKEFEGSFVFPFERSSQWVVTFENVFAKLWSSSNEISWLRPIRNVFSWMHGVCKTARIRV